MAGHKPTALMLPTSKYDSAKADRAVAFFNALTHTIGQWDGVPFTLLPWQEKIIRDVFGVVDKKSGYRQFRQAYIEVPKKQGKALALDTPIPTPSGWTTMGTVREGDRVLGADGKPCTVTYATDVMIRHECFRVSFSDGSGIVADREHLWQIETGKKQKVVTTWQIRKQLKRGKTVTITDWQEPKRRIVSVKAVPSVPVRCIQVDSPDHLYLAGESRIPTHNTELDAAIALKLLCADDEPAAEVYGCASDRQQAAICFNVAAKMVQNNAVLSKRIKIIESKKRMIYLPNGSFYQVLSSEAYSKHGFNIHGLIFDELHAQPNRKLFDVMTKGSGDARRQPLFVYTTTAGDDTKSVCYEQHCKAKDILEGRKKDPSFYPVIYAADDDDDWTDPKVWKKANPSLGVTVPIERVREACEQAKQNPSEENTFRQLRLCQWVKQAVRWMPMDKWDACAIPVDPASLEGRVCYGGLDLSSTSDITAFVLVFPPDTEDGIYYVMPFFWLPEDTIELRSKRDHVLYDVWHREGLFEVTEGNVIHYGFIEAFINELGQHYNIREIAFDRWGATQMTQNLEYDGFSVVPFGQGFRDMSPPTKELMKLVLEERIAHGGNPVLRWMMDNVTVRKDPAGNIKMDKEKSTEKIDGAVALVMALDRAIRNGNKTNESIYDQRDMLFV